MSQNSTARTGSECDGDFKEIRNTNARSRASSGKSKRDIFGGPFGDSPLNRPQGPSLQDYLLVMIRNNEETSGTSESSQTDFDLYNLRNTYTEQLNIVRKKLNLMALSEEDCQRCVITEIDENEPCGSNDDKEVHKENNSVSTRLASSEATFTETKKSSGHEIKTIHPFSLNYSLDSVSSTNVFEPDYSPPKKKVCQRLQTPRFISVSEGNVPYYTKVGIHESLFREDTKPQDKEKKTVHQFTETRQTQCNEDEFSHMHTDHSKGALNATACNQCSVGEGSSNQETEREFSEQHLSLCLEERYSIVNLSIETEETETELSEDEKPNSGVLFPNVIIERVEESEEEESSLSSRCSKKCTTTSSSNKETVEACKKIDALSLNSVRGSSDDDTCTVLRMNTIIDTSKQKKRSKMRRIRRQSRASSVGRISVYEEITRLHSASGDNKMDRGGNGDALKKGEVKEKRLDATKLKGGMKGDAVMEDDTKTGTIKGVATQVEVATATDTIKYDFTDLNNYMSELSHGIQLKKLINTASERSITGEGKSKLNRYIRHYVNYKKEIEKAKSASGEKKHSIIGQKVVNIHNRFLGSTEKMYQSETSLVSDEDISGMRTSSPGNTSGSGSGTRKRFWERFCLCLCPEREVD